MKSRKTILRVIIAAALLVSMVIAGTSIDTLQKQHKIYAAGQAKQQEQRTIQSLRSNLAKGHRMQIRKVSLRAGKCKNAALGEQTLGNDSSVT